MRILTLVCALSVTSAAIAQPAADKKPAKKAVAVKSLDELLKQVETGGTGLDGEVRAREAEFVGRKDQQRQLLDEALAREEALAKRSASLEAQFEANEARAVELETLLQKRLGSTGELFGVVRQVAGDTSGHVRNSIVSAQLPDRHLFLDELGQSKQLPSIDELQKLWFVLQQEMTESGRVARFEADVVEPGGQTVKREVVRVGTFNAVGDGRYLRWLPESGKLAVLGRQPPSRYLSTVRDLERAKSGQVRFALDPSRGSILSLVVQAPSNEERLEQGGTVGYIIIFLGAAAFGFGILRLLWILVVATRVRLQLARPDDPKPGNALGRVLSVAPPGVPADIETLERKLDEAVLKEGSKIERYLWLIKVVSAVAPLLGLLGTVTGMINTFQQITLYGTGDPKMMAGGISEALMTTMLGLCVAIPLVLLHSGLASLCRRIVDVLHEQAAGLIALRAEGATGAAPTAAPATAPTAAPVEAQ